MRMNDRRFGPDSGPGLPGGVTADMPLNASATARSMAAMAPGSMIMPTGRAYAKGGMVGCDWKAPSAKTMRGAARSKGM